MPSAADVALLSPVMEALMANVRFENLTVKYGTHIILNNFSLEVKSGQILRLYARFWG